MASSSSATTKPADQARTTPSLGGIMHEWRQWLAPGVVVTVVLAMGSLQRADIREIKTDVREFRAEVQADIRELRADIRELNNRMDQVNVRIDQIYQLLLP